MGRKPFCLKQKQTGLQEQKHTYFYLSFVCCMNVRCRVSMSSIFASTLASFMLKVKKKKKKSRPTDPSSEKWLVDNQTIYFFWPNQDEFWPNLSLTKITKKKKKKKKKNHHPNLNKKVTRAVQSNLSFYINFESCISSPWTYQWGIKSIFFCYYWPFQCIATILRAENLKGDWSTRHLCETKWQTGSVQMIT